MVKNFGINYSLSYAYFSTPLEMTFEDRAAKG
jgi:hypothetical protein